MRHLLLATAALLPLSAAPALAVVTTYDSKSVFDGLYAATTVSFPCSLVGTGNTICTSPGGVGTYSPPGSGVVFAAFGGTVDHPSTLNILYGPAQGSQFGPLPGSQVNLGSPNFLVNDDGNNLTRGISAIFPASHAIGLLVAFFGESGPMTVSVTLDGGGTTTVTPPTWTAPAPSTWNVGDQGHYSFVGVSSDIETITGISIFAESVNGTADNPQPQYLPVIGLLEYGNARVTNPIPEPASLALLGAGLFGLGLSRRRR